MLLQTAHYTSEESKPLNSDEYIQTVVQISLYSERPNDKRLPMCIFVEIRWV